MNNRLLNKLGWAVTSLMVLVLLADAAADFFAVDKIAPMMAETGFAVSSASVLGIICLACAALYAIPQTAVFGAILITGFFGGAICTHLRIGELGSAPQIESLIFGVLTWGALWLRDPRLRSLLPLRR